LAGPVLLFLAGYSYTKRYTAFSHFWLGVSLLLAPLAAWIAICGPVGVATPALLGAAVFFWVAGFDIIYACQDADFDRRAGLFSLPAAVGVRYSLRTAAVCHCVMVLLLAALAAVNPFLGFTYLAGVGAVALLLLYEHWIVRPDDLSRVNQAFFYVNAIISVGLLAVVVLQVSLAG
jgi:4-hydroxybenzoate polyprenyltransferase